MHGKTLKTLLGGAVLMAVLLLAGFAAPQWLLFTATKAIGYGIVALGIVVLMRGGVVSFGQGMVYCAGAYAAGLIAANWGLTDALVLLTIGGVTGIVIGAVVGPLIARYRGIFFAMLTVALSMVLYGVLVKMNQIGGSDGFNVPEPTFFGWPPDRDSADLALYCTAIVVAGVTAMLCRVYFDSMAGLMSRAVRENELRVEYLGTSVHRTMVLNFVVAAGFGGVGGALNGMALGHVDPLFSFWTTSGEFVFVAILAGPYSVAAVFVASIILELVRSFSNLYFPETWQLVLGAFLLAVILFLPEGIGSLWAKGRIIAPRTPRDDVTRSRAAEDRSTGGSRVATATRAARPTAKEPQA
ncbi:High-affinity branched-chain amino acid transport system permease protein LivH [Caenispirillum salinarum AK4]|uniref:High-affinity branched-chain amino acid transport system permease protein LivH n=1 Tax=Caenispirillum salinarum AK4 TaxID=1238182 RepID=K9GRA1_9PROT|nr:branched-chain amino acid ABC transporter permease [Caenispirillum salinarum]EKV27632.1 High-affinity branched-chain amino acid transport system permease protein LivH [Caenispirillum salinarum AK4]